MDREEGAKRTKTAVLGTSIVNEPLLVLYSLLIFILHRDLGATPLQIGVLVMLKPMASIISLYWSSWINRGRRFLRASIVWTGILCRLPFFFFPFIDNAWVMIGLAALFMVLHRGGIPPWMEALKLNLPGKQRGRVFSRGLALGYAEGVVLAIFIGALLDGDGEAWRWMFPLSAALGMIGVALQGRLPVPLDPKEVPRPKVSIAQPWRQTWKILRENRPFRRFQIGFFVAAFGLMLMLPSLPTYFDDVLGLSYIQLAIALSVCKGIGFALTSPGWGRLLRQANVFSFISLVFALFGAFAVGLVAAGWHVWFVYFAYLMYGVAQAGSKLIWHLSGPIFSSDEDSAPLTSVNVVMVGIRGCVAPALGTLLCASSSPVVALAVGGSFFLFSAALVRSWSREEVVVTA